MTKSKHVTNHQLPIRFLQRVAESDETYQRNAALAYDQARKGLLTGYSLAATIGWLQRSAFRRYQESLRRKVMA